MIETSSQSVKTEHSVSHKIYLKRKQLCPNHDLKYRYKCQYPFCQNPFICRQNDCIDQHFHNQQNIILSKFNLQHLNGRFELAQKAIINEQNKCNQAHFYRTTIENFRTSIQELFHDLDSYRAICQELRNQKEKPIIFDLADKCESIVTLQTKIKESIDSFKAKFIPFNEDGQKNNYFQFRMRNSLEIYLTTQINMFSWDKCIDIWNSQKKSNGGQKFHQRLQNKPNLLFLFIGQRMVIGSYYPDPYPDLQTRTIKSPDSFIFLNSGNQNDNFVTFKANPESDHHLKISEKLIICHGNTPSWGDGVRTFARNFESIDYYLPSNSYMSPLPLEEDQIKIYCGNLKLTSLKVMQVKIEQ